MLKVLVADDQSSLRLLICATIESDDYEILEAADGDCAWSILQEQQPAVALLDVQMPGRSGLEVTKAIRAEPALAGTKVILLTSKAQQQEVQAGLEAGADAYLTKPFSPRELISTIERALHSPRETSVA